MARATAPAITRAVLEDRWDGLMTTGRAGVSTKLQVRLDGVIRQLFERVARIEWTGELDGEGHDGTGSVTDEVETIIRRELLDRIERRGLAR